MARRNPLFDMFGQGSFAELRKKPFGRNKGGAIHRAAVGFANQKLSRKKGFQQRQAEMRQAAEAAKERKAEEEISRKEAERERNKRIKEEKKFMEQYGNEVKKFQSQLKKMVSEMIKNGELPKNSHFKNKYVLEQMAINLFKEMKNNGRELNTKIVKNAFTQTEQMFLQSTGGKGLSLKQPSMEKIDNIRLMTKNSITQVFQNAQ